MELTEQGGEMAQKTSVLNFKDESRKFAAALQVEHGALGDLMNIMATPELAPQMAEAVALAQKAWDDVRFQKARTEAARGTAA